MARANINAMDMTKQVTVSVKIRGWRQFRIRLTIAKVLFRLGAWVANFNIEFDEDTE